MNGGLDVDSIPKVRRYGIGVIVTILSGSHMVHGPISEAPNAIAAGEKLKVRLVDPSVDRGCFC